MAAPQAAGDEALGRRGSATAADAEPAAEPAGCCAGAPPPPYVAELLPSTASVPLRDEAAAAMIPFCDLFRFASGPTRVLIYVGVACACATGVTMPAFMYFFGELLDGMSGNDEVVEKVTGMALLLLYVGLGCFVVASVASACMGVAGGRITAEIRRQYFAAIMRQEPGWFDKERAGALAARLSGDTMLIQSALGSNVLLFFVYMTTVFLSYALGFYVSWRLTLVIIASFPLIGVSAAVMQRSMSVATSRKQDAYAGAGAIAEEALSSIRTVHAFGAHRRVHRRFVATLGAARDAGQRAAWLSGGALGVSQLCLFSSYCVALIYGSYLITWRMSTTGEVMTCFFSVLVGSMQLGLLADPWAKISEGRTAAVGIYAVIDRTPLIVSGTRTIPDDQFRGEIRIENAAFAYPSRPQSQIFEGFDLGIPAGQTTALVGMSGCGKSSLVGIMQRFYDLQAECYAWESDGGLRNLDPDVVRALAAARRGGAETASVPVRLSDGRGLGEAEVPGTLEVDFARMEVRPTGLDGGVAYDAARECWVARAHPGGARLPAEVGRVLARCARGTARFELAGGRYEYDAATRSITGVAAPLRRVETGRVSVDGVPLEELDLRWWRQQIGMVSQEPVLFAGSVLDNVRAGAPDADEAAVAQALRDANLAAFATAEGMRVEVGEGGGKLSGGQKQRVAIARAIIRRPRVLLLDEATSALDRASEVEVQAALATACGGGGGRAPTAIVIAHRLVTVQDADRICVLRPIGAKGVAGGGTAPRRQRRGTTVIELEESGGVRGEAHRLLVARGGHYASLWQMQMADSGSQDPSPARSAAPSPKPAAQLAAPYGDTESDRAGAPTSPPPPRAGTSPPLNPADIGEQLRELMSPTKKPVTAAAAGDAAGPEPAAEAEVKARVEELVLQCPGARRWIAVGLVGCLLNALVMPAYAFVLSYVLEEFTNLDPEIIAWRHNMSQVNGTWGKWAEGGWQAEEVPERSRDTINLLAILFIAVGELGLFGPLLQQGAFGHLGEELTHKIRSMLFIHLLRQDMAFYDRPENDSGTLTGMLSGKAEAVHALYGPSLGTVLQIIICMTVSLGFAFYYQWELTLILVACVPVIAFANYVNTKLFMMNSAPEEDGAGETTGAVTGETIRNFRTVIMFDVMPRAMARYEAVEVPEARKRARRAVAAGVAYGFSQFTNLGVIALAFWYGGILIQAGRATFLDVQMSVMMVILGAMGLGQATALQGTAAVAREAAAAIFGALDRAPGIDQLGGEGERLGELRRIVFDDVAFAYPTRKRTQVLRHFSLSIPVPDPAAPRGEQVALIGGTGSGKSTVMALLQRLYDPDSGAVLLYDAAGRSLDLRRADLQWYRGVLSVVQQEPVLFNESVIDNVRYGNPGATAAEVRTAAEAAQIATEVESWPDGYDTAVGARGGMLSGGQKQRVAIARAVVGSPGVLLLDEATSALDNASEREVQAALESIQQGQAGGEGAAAQLRRMTTVAVAHKLPTIEACDPICVIHKGRVAERGSHKELMAIPDGDYRRRYQLYHSLAAVAASPPPPHGSDGPAQ